MSPATHFSAAEAAVVSLCVVLGIVMVMVHRRRLRRRAGLPPGSEGMPMVGETLELVAAYRSGDPEPFIDSRVRLHGRVFTSHVFGERTVFSADPELNRLVLSSEGRGFESSYPPSISALLGAHSLVLLRGARHRCLHSLALSRFASAAALRSPLLPDADRIVRRTLSSWAGGGGVVRLLEEAKKISFDLTVRQLMGRDPGEWGEGLRRHYVRVMDGFFSLPLSLPGFLSSYTAYGRALGARKKVADALREVVRERRAKAAGREEVKRAMLDDLLEAERGMEEEEVVDFMLALLVAGYETTSTIMTLAVKFLTACPPAHALLMEEQEEIQKKKGSDTEPLEWSDYRSMPFTQCVINETLRVGNIIGGVFRRATSDVHFKGFRIPKGCKVFASFRAVHLDPGHYEDARTFDPWRWAGEESSRATTIAPPSQQTTAGGAASVFTPFGGGPRLCPGYALARLEISVFLHYLLTGFRWEVAEEDKVVYFPTTRTEKGFPIKVWKRRPAEAATGN